MSSKSFFNQFILFAITIIGLVALISCQDDDKKTEAIELIKTVYDADSSNPMVVFLVDYKDVESKNYNIELRKTINYTKIPYQQLDVSEFNEYGLLAPTTKVVVIRDTKVLSKIAMTALIAFVNSGNTLFFPNASEDEKFGFFMGVKPNSDYIVNTTAKGFTFKTPFIPEFKNKSYFTNIVHYGLAKENFSSKIEVLATAENESNYPTIIKNRLGKGFAIAFNTTQYAQKQDRGLLFAGVLSGLSNVPYPVANVSTIFLDDFPAPLYTGIQEPIKSEYHINQAQFYKKIWWPDMVKLAKTYHLTYTAIPCFDYRDKTEPPFLFPEWDSSTEMVKGKSINNSDWLMQQVFANGFEMGFHGYNHESLVRKDWENPDFMITSLNAANKRWNSLNYGALPQTYVPPSNIIDQTGVNALVEGMPNITTISSLYLGDFSEGGDREFDMEPYNSKFFNFPRNTSGYDMSIQAQFDHQSLFLYTGIWNHFVHPDDVYQIPAENTTDSKGNFAYRNPNAYGWRVSKDKSLGLLPRFENYIKNFQKQYPLTPSISTIEAVKRTKSWRKASYNIDLEKLNFSLSETLNTNTYWMMYVKSSNWELTQLNLKNQKLKFSTTPVLNGVLVMIETNTAQLLLGTDKKLIESTNEDNNTIISDSVKNYEVYTSGNPVFETLDEEIDFAIKNNNISKAIALLKEKILAQKTPNLKDLNTLDTYFNWEEKPQETWTFLDQLYSKSRSKFIIDYSINLSKSNDYPDLQTRKKWLLRQMAMYPNQTSLKIAYNDYFETETESILSPEELWEQLEKSTSPTSKSQLLLELMEKDILNALVYIQKLQPCDVLYANEISGEIAQFLAEQSFYNDAILWSKCAKNITKETLVDWYINAKDLESLKTLDLAAYLNYLLVTDSAQALKTLENLSPCSLENLNTDDVAYAYGNANYYRRALSWAKCNKEFPVIDQLQWLAELQDYDSLIKMYQNYSLNNPDDDSVKLYMTAFYLGQSSQKDAFAIAETLSTKDSKRLVIPDLNEALNYASLEDKRFIIKTYPDLILDSTLALIKKELRLQTGHYLESQSTLVTDRLNPTALGNLLSYHFYNTKLAKHSFGINQYNAYAINTNENDIANRDHNLYGVHYGYAFKERTNKFNFSTKALIERNSENKLFYNSSLRATKSKDSLYSSIGLSIRPAITGPAYSLNIYRSQLEVYEEYQFNSKISGVLALEGNYYTDKVIDGLVVSKFIYSYKFKSFDSLNPYTEIAGMLGNTNRVNGFPYWTIKERFYGGIGINYLHNNPSTKLEYGVNVGGFLDTFSDQFLRYGGQVNYPISDYFKLNANAEFYTLKNFYSNNFNVGLTYYLK